VGLQTQKPSVGGVWIFSGTLNTLYKSHNVVSNSNLLFSESQRGVGLQLGLQDKKNAGLWGSEMEKMKALGFHSFTSTPGFLATISIFVRAPSRERLPAPGYKVLKKPPSVWNSRFYCDLCFF